MAFTFTQGLILATSPSRLTRRGTRHLIRPAGDVAPGGPRQVRVSSIVRPRGVRRGKIQWIAVLLLLIAGCDLEEMRNNMIPQDEAEFAKQHLALYQAQDFDQIIGQLNPQIIGDDTRSKLEELSGYFPDGQPIDIQIVGSHTMTSPGTWSANLTFQYQFSESFLIATVALLKRDDQLMINGINLQVLESSLEEINQFNVGGRGGLGYLFLILAVAIPIFIVGSFVECLRTPIPKRKWLWAIFVLMGVGVMRLNWTTGEFAYSMLSWQLLGAGFLKPMYGPLVLSVAAPIGAIVFWARRKEWLEKADESEA